jgi:expansin (peptidoglycan-binding protein)
VCGVAGAQRRGHLVDASGLGEGPFTFRVTDVHGNVIEDSGIPLLDDADAPGASQLPACL